MSRFDPFPRITAYIVLTLVLVLLAYSSCVGSGYV